MQRLLIHTVLPAIFVALPVAAAGLIAAAIPADARRDYLDRVAVSPVDWIILAVGFSLFAAQTVLAWRALRWQPAAENFDERADRWLAHLAQGAEWFPLLGLIGTVAAILQTFSSFTPGANPSPAEIIRKYAPAITATGGGLFMALINILPSWVVAVGRDLIRALAGYPTPIPPAAEEVPAPAAPVATGNSDRGARA